MKTQSQRKLWLKYLRQNGSGFAQKCAMLLDADESQLAGLSIDPANYHDPDSFALDYQALCFVKKWSGLATGIDTKKVAIEAFFDGERRLYNVNRRLQRDDAFSQRGWEVIFTAQRKIATLLGPFSLFKVQAHGWGPGATATLKGKAATLVHKIREDRLSVTADCLDLAQNCVGLDLHWLRARGIPADGPCSLLESEFIVTRGSRLLTVPKDATKDRTIAAEPTVNLFLQKGVGAYLRSRLALCGVDLDDQQLNQRLAAKAFRDRLATIDLKNASNSVSTSLVELLLPPEWFAYLDSIRTKWTEYEGRGIRLEMFSSMGNGFTFELESLIFWALCRACTDDVVGVYGDDIIVPQSAAPLVIAILEACGFSVNTTKSFLSGNFFESCGKHYFMGVDVTPLYWKESEPEQLRSSDHASVALSCGVLNALIRRCQVIEDQCLLTVLTRYRTCLKSMWLTAIRDHELVCVVPIRSESDEGFALPTDRLMRYAVQKDRNRGFRVPIIRRSGRRHLFKTDGGQQALLAYTLRFSPSEPLSLNGLGIRGEPRLLRSYAWFGWHTVMK